MPGGIASERAENILCFFYDQCEQPIGAPKNNTPKRKQPEKTLEEAIEDLNQVHVSPNPADLYIEFEFELLESSKENTLRIIDTQGRPVQIWNLGVENMGIRVLDTRKLPNGVYFYELVQEDTKLKSGKFIVQH